jgi:hypothetical protein
LSRLLERENEAHTALGDTASLMGQYDAGAEEEEIRKVLAGRRDFDAAVQTVAQATAPTAEGSLLTRLLAAATGTTSAPVSPAQPSTLLYPDELSYLREAIQEAYPDPGASLERGGVNWREHPGSNIVEFAPPPDLQQRLKVLPQAYLQDRKVDISFKLATTKGAGKAELQRALSDEHSSSWPEAHFLGPLHPVIDWATDRALGRLERNHIFAVRGDVDHPTVLLIGTLTNKRGHVVATTHLTAIFPVPRSPDTCFIEPHESAVAMLGAIGLAATAPNPGALPNAAALSPFVRKAVMTARSEMERLLDSAAQHTLDRVDRWSQRAVHWEQEADVLVQRSEIAARRVTVKHMEDLVESMRPDRHLVRPLLVVVPRDFAIAAPGVV